MGGFFLPFLQLVLTGLPIKCFCFGYLSIKIDLILKISRQKILFLQLLIVRGGFAGRIIYSLNKLHSSFSLMNINDEIGKYLKEQIESAENDFNDLETIPLFKDLFKKLKGVNHQQVIADFKKQLDKNCLEWWTNADQGINISEKLYCIFFEHSYLTTQEKPDAAAYGVKKIETLKIQEEDYDLGGDYELASEFYALPGVELSMCAPLYGLDWSQLPEEYTEDGKDVEDEPGFAELLDAYTFTAYSLLHQAILEFVETSTFAKLNRKSGFQFLIQEHDLGDAQPLYIAAS